MAKGKRITIRLKQGLGVLSPERDEQDNLKHLGDRDENGKPLDHDVPAAFGYALIQEGRATLVDSHGTTVEDVMQEDDDTPRPRGRGR